MHDTLFIIMIHYLTMRCRDACQWNSLSKGHKYLLDNLYILCITVYIVISTLVMYNCVYCYKYLLDNNILVMYNYVYSYYIKKHTMLLISISHYDFITNVSC